MRGSSEAQWVRGCRVERRLSHAPGARTLNLHTSASSSRFKPFEEARAFVRELGLTGQEEWEDGCRVEGNRPRDIPSGPDHTYRGNKGWLSWQDWLGYGEGKGPRNKFLPFEEARTFARKQGLTSSTEWREWCNEGNRPDDIPSTPDQTYREEGWESWPDWMGYSPYKK